MKGSCLALLLVTLVACGAGTKLTQENFQKVQDGMTIAQVEDILGKPNKVDSTTLPLLGTATVYTYQAGSSEATLIFYKDELKMKSGSLAE